MRQNFEKDEYIYTQEGEVLKLPLLSCHRIIFLTGMELQENFGIYPRTIGSWKDKGVAFPTVVVGCSMRYQYNEVQKFLLNIELI